MEMGMGMDLYTKMDTEMNIKLNIMGNSGPPGIWSVRYQNKKKLTIPEPAL
jgi:hypothetical protein